jgi:hemerythrin superfamily protein
MATEQNETNPTTESRGTGAAPATATEGTDAISFLTAQHREVDALFAEIEGAGDRAVKTKEKLFAKIAEKLTLHTKIEESIFYPAAKAADDDLVLEALEEHDNVKAMLRKLKKTEGGDETFDAKITVLKELVKHHVKEEEQELFPKCREALGEDALQELGEELQAKFEHLQTLQ